VTAYAPGRVVSGPLFAALLLGLLPAGGGPPAPWGGGPDAEGGAEAAGGPCAMLDPRRITFGSAVVEGIAAVGFVPAGFMFIVFPLSGPTRLGAEVIDEGARAAGGAEAEGGCAPIGHRKPGYVLRGFMA